MTHIKRNISTYLDGIQSIEVFKREFEGSLNLKITKSGELKKKIERKSCLLN